mgnify:CR=1 FL=1
MLPLLVQEILYRLETALHETGLGTIISEGIAKDKTLFDDKGQLFTIVIMIFPMAPLIKFVREAETEIRGFIDVIATMIPDV